MLFLEFLLLVVVTFSFICIADLIRGGVPYSPYLLLLCVSLLLVVLVCLKVTLFADTPFSLPLSTAVFFLAIYYLYIHNDDDGRVRDQDL